MKLRILIVLLLVAFYPFIAGDDGCGGNIQLAEDGLNVATGEVPLPPEVLVDAADIQGAARTDGKPGTEKLVCEKPGDEKTPDYLISCSKYFRSGKDQADLFMAIDVPSALAHMDELNEIQAFMTIMGEVRQGLGYLDQKMSKEELLNFLDGVDSMCLACWIGSGANSDWLKSDAVMRDSLNKDTNWTSDSNMMKDLGNDAFMHMCRDMESIVVFKEPFSFEGLLPDRMKAQDKNGNFKLSDRVLGFQAAENAVIAGTQGPIDQIHPDASTVAVQDAADNLVAKLIGKVQPSTVAVLFNKAGTLLFKDDPMLHYFKAVLGNVNITAYKEPLFISALNFGKELVSMSSTMYEFEEEFARMYIAMKYIDFAAMAEDLRSDARQQAGALDAEVDAIIERMAKLEQEKLALRDEEARLRDQLDVTRDQASRDELQKQIDEIGMRYERIQIQILDLASKLSQLYGSQLDM